MLILEDHTCKNFFLNPGQNKHEQQRPNFSTKTELIQTHRALRAVAGTTSMQQTISELGTNGQTYRLQFFYASYAYSDTCTMTVSFGGVPVFTQKLPRVPNTGSVNPYSLVTVDAITPMYRAQVLEFAVFCRTSTLPNFILIDDVAFGTPSC